MWIKINKRLKDCTLMDCPDPFADKIKCEECKHWIDKSDASETETLGFCRPIRHWYCPLHKKPYTKCIIRGSSDNIIYYGEVLMEENGTPIGYKKITK